MTCIEAQDPLKILTYALKFCLLLAYNYYGEIKPLHQVHNLFGFPKIIPSIDFLIQFWYGVNKHMTMTSPNTG